MILTPAEMFLILCIAGLAYALYKEKEKMQDFRQHISKTFIDLHEGKAEIQVHQVTDEVTALRVIPKRGRNENTN